MKVRMIVVEADDVSPSDLSIVISRLLSQASPEPAPAALPAPDAPPEAPATEPKRNHPWRSTPKPTGKPRGQVRQATGGVTDPRPATAKLLQCRQCSADHPDGPDGDRRKSCSKCGSGRCWESIEPKRPVETGSE
jgi:hypothetical protein